jgi:hypothetical protein
LFLFFHKRLCGPLANSRPHHQPDAQRQPHSRLEAGQSSCRCSDPESRRFSRRRLTRGLPLLESFSQTSPGQESKPTLRANPPYASPAGCAKRTQS